MNCWSNASNGCNPTRTPESDGKDGETRLTCLHPPGFSALDTDCDDFDRNIFPLAGEICDQRDNDCDGKIEELIKNVGEELCDGKIDEGCECTAGLGRQCDTKQSGACAIGFRICSSLGMWSDCQSIVEPADEDLCDGSDADCDGVVDNPPGGYP